MPDPAPLPLYVDMDGCLVKSDTLTESALLLLRRAPWKIITLLRWAGRGRAVLKRRLAETVELDPALLPYQSAFLQWLEVQQKTGRRLILATASDDAAARRTARYLGLFDEVIASDGVTNLKGWRKLEAIRSHAGGPFAYAGNDVPDLPIWAAAAERIIVNPTAAVRPHIRELDGLRFEDRPSAAVIGFRQLRVSQWLKNSLLFLPMLLAHRLQEPALYGRALLAFFAFSLTASAVYLLNDLFDLAADRLHPRKANRPLAAGDLLPQRGALAVPLLLLAAAACAVWLPLRFSGWLGLYLLLNLGYSFRLKRVFLLDVLLLSLMYPLRILAGSAATGVPCSSWLIGFGAFFFLSLAFIKRFAEVRQLRESARGEQAAGRAYGVRHLAVLRTAGLCSAAGAVAVFALYVLSEQIQTVYDRPAFFWGITLLLAGWLARVWHLALTGHLSDDPVAFALSDRFTYGIALAALLLMVAASSPGTTPALVR